MKIAYFIFTLSLVNLFKRGIAQMEAHIVGGDYASQYNNAHSAFLAVSCKRCKLVKTWSCGSSIVNQRILLTAAHCLQHCLYQPDVSIAVGTGSVNKHLAIQYITRHFKLHPDYDAVYFDNDIGLVMLENNLKFSPIVKRVVLMRKPPYYDIATITGWGIVDEKKRVTTGLLKEAQQKVLKEDVCENLLQDNMPPKTFCADTEYNKNRVAGYVAGGDSGSALMVHGYIQIGIVSYKNPKTSLSVAVYTDVAGHIDWIENASKWMICHHLVTRDRNR